LKTVHQSLTFPRLYLHRVSSQSKRTASSRGICRWRWVFLMDNWPSYVTNEVLGLLRDARLRIITRVPRTTQIF
jgi:hypothetical protein